MRPVYITVLQEETGKRIKALMDDRRLNVRDIQTACGFEQPQAVYKWLSGKSLPSIENMVILSVVLGTPIDSILVRSGDASFFFRQETFLNLTPFFIRKVILIYFV